MFPHKMVQKNDVVPKLLTLLLQFKQIFKIYCKHYEPEKK